MKYLMISPGLCVRPTMEKPVDQGLVMNRQSFNVAVQRFNEHAESLTKLPTTCTLPVGEWFEGEEKWHVHTSSYQGEGNHYFDTEREADKKYDEWSKYNGQLQCHTDKPRKVIVPDEANNRQQPPKNANNLEETKVDPYGGTANIWWDGSGNMRQIIQSSEYKDACHKCGNPVGNMIFTFCDGCWDEIYPPSKSEPVEQEGEVMRAMTDKSVKKFIADFMGTTETVGMGCSSPTLETSLFVLRFLQSLKQSDAVEFAKWLDEMKVKADREFKNFPRHATTEELYKLFTLK